MGLQVSNGYDEWPDVLPLPESLWVDWPSWPTSSCTFWLFSCVELYEEECPEQMENLPFVGEEEALHKHSPQSGGYLGTTTKEGAKSMVF